MGKFYSWYTRHSRAANLPIISYAALSLYRPTNFNSLFKIFPGGVRISRFDQNVPHDFLSIPQPWEKCTASVQATAELQIYL